MRETLAAVPGKLLDADTLGARLRLDAGYIAANPVIFGQAPPPEAFPAVLAALYLLIDWSAQLPGARDGVDEYLGRQLPEGQLRDVRARCERFTEGMDALPAFEELLPQLAQDIADEFSLPPELLAELRQQLSSCFDGTGPERPPLPAPEMPRPRISFFDIIHIIAHKILTPSFQNKHPFLFDLFYPPLTILVYAIFVFPLLIVLDIFLAHCFR